MPSVSQSPIGRSRGDERDEDDPVRVLALHVPQAKSARKEPVVPESAVDGKLSPLY